MVDAWRTAELRRRAGFLPHRAGMAMGRSDPRVARARTCCGWTIDVLVCDRRTAADGASVRPRPDLPSNPTASRRSSTNATPLEVLWPRFPGRSGNGDLSEPPLEKLAEKDRASSVYRFLWLPSFHDLISVQFVKSDEGAVLHAVRLKLRQS
jgi:hypothetical protein